MNSIMIQGTSSGAGKTILVAALCRILSNMGYNVAPFKSQNMSSRSYTTGSGLEISVAQAVQAAAARCEITPELNPILLKPDGNSSSTVYLGGTKYGSMDARRYYEEFVLHEGLSAAAEALASLRRKFDIVVLEGAGSPAEINLKQYDIANMRMARLAEAPVILVADIDRGGSFAAQIGTMALLPLKDMKRVGGFVMNKFRGDPEVLEQGLTKLTEMTEVPVIGVLPMLDLSCLPDEDSLDAVYKDDYNDADNDNKSDVVQRWQSGEPPACMDECLEMLADAVDKNLDVDLIMKMINR